MVFTVLGDKMKIVILFSDDRKFTQLINTNEVLR